MARMLAVGSQTIPRVMPRSSPMKDKDPPVKYKITCEPEESASSQQNEGARHTSVQSSEEDCREDTTNAPDYFSI